MESSLTGLEITSFSDEIQLNKKSIKVDDYNVKQWITVNKGGKLKTSS